MNAVAVNPREVAAVRLGVGRGAKHSIILRTSGVELPVSFTHAVKMFDRLHDRLTPSAWKVANSKPKRRVRK